MAHVRPWPRQAAFDGRVPCRGASVPEVHWIQPGEAAARDALDGASGFLTPARWGGGGALPARWGGVLLQG